MARLDELLGQLLTLATLARRERPELGDVILVCGCEWITAPAVIVASPRRGWLTCHRCRRKLRPLLAFNDPLVAALRAGGQAALVELASALYVEL